MYSEEILKEIKKQQSGSEVSAIAQVVRREAPSSGKPGDKAIISADGTVNGWIGGGCTKGIIIKESLAAIKDKKPRLVRILPTDQLPDMPGVKNYRMTCASGGTVEVYIEPIMPVTQLKIFGRSHIAKSLCELGKASGFNVEIISDLAEKEMFPTADSILELKRYQPVESPNSFAVVCTQGENDANSLLAAIKTQPKYLGFVASRKKANSIMMGLKREGVSHDDLVKIKTPAGIDINAKTPEEVAVSILAQIIQVKREADKVEENSKMEDLQMELTEDLYVNPVCKIPIQKSTAKYILDYEGEKVYFCCDGCKESFEKDPDAYMKVK